jgi:hypothetical protein
VLSLHCEPNGAWLLIRLVKRDETEMITHHYEETKKRRRKFDGFGIEGRLCGGVFRGGNIASARTLLPFSSLMQVYSS